MEPVFSYDPQLSSVLGTPVTSISDAIQIMEAIDSICVDTDGLKWFNRVYLEVTKAVAARVDAKDFARPEWIAALDVQFASLYFAALRDWLAGSPACPKCWDILFNSRDRIEIGRIQFALAGINAHIDRDLPVAIVNACRLIQITPKRATEPYSDYASLNATLDSLIDVEKKTLNLRLPGDPLPAISAFEDHIAAWSIAALREMAWSNGEVLWLLQTMQPMIPSFLHALDGMSTGAGTRLLEPLP